MLIFNSIGLCLSGLFACVIVSMPIVQGRGVRRHHRHHRYSHPYYYDFADDLEYRDSPYGQAEERGHIRNILSRLSSEYEEQQQQVSSSSREYKSDLRDRLVPARQRQKTSRDIDNIDSALSSTRFAARRKRHNKRIGLDYRIDLMEKESEITRLPQSHETKLERIHGVRFELDVKEAQNRSICNYTVESIPDTRGSRIPRDLENVRCNYVGSDCQGANNSYCCVQTYKFIDVSYGDGYSEKMKIYVGCVCAYKKSDAHKKFDKDPFALAETLLPITD